MTAKQHLHEVLENLPDSRVEEVLDFARFLKNIEQENRRETQEWRELGRVQLAKAYGENEPEYTEADLKVRINP